MQEAWKAPHPGDDDNQGNIQGGDYCDDTDDDGGNGGSDCDLATFTQTGQRAPPSQTPHPGQQIS